MEDYTRQNVLKYAFFIIQDISKYFERQKLYLNLCLSK